MVSWCKVILQNNSPESLMGEVVNIAQGSKRKLYRKGKVRVQC